jgi:hypothetical protein
MKMNFFLLTALCAFTAIVSRGQTLESVVSAGNYTTKNVWIGMAPDSTVTENGLNLSGKLKLISYSTVYTTGTDANQPTIYRSGTRAGTYPFNNYDNLILQAGIQNRDILFVTGATPGPKMVVTGAGNIGIGTTTPAARVDIDGSGEPLRMSRSGFGSWTFALTSNPLGTGNIVHANTLTIFNRNTAGDFAISTQPTVAPSFIVKSTGNVGIGTLDPGTYKLAVEGTIGARRIKVVQSAWADFVFEPTYKLPSLAELETYIKVNKHLPDVPSAEEVSKNGLDVGEMNKILLQKIEELTLHVIEGDKRNRELEERIKKLEKQGAK